VAFLLNLINDNKPYHPLPKDVEKF